MSEALKQAAQKLLAHVEDKGEGRRSTCLPFDVEALRAALSQPAPSPQPAVPVVSDEQIRKTVEAVQDPDTVPAFHNGYYTLTPGELRRVILALRPAVEPMTWPKGRDVGRYGDMSPGQHLRVGLDSDNDAYVSVLDEDGGASVEFCNPGGGGGGSSRRTREALIALMVAIEADNAERPDKDWWARRNGITAKAEDAHQPTKEAEKP